MQHDRDPETPAQDPPGIEERNEWVALMCLIAESDRDLYRQLRAEAWEAAQRSGIGSEISN